MTERSKEITFETLAINIPGIVYRVYLREPIRMVFFNDMLQQMTGYEASELKVGEMCSIDPIIISEDHSDVMRIVENAVRDDKPFEVGYRIKHKDGSIRYFLERGSPIYGDDKQPELIDGIILDVTEHKQIDEALHESEEKFRSLVETTSDWIWEVDANGIYTYASPRVRDLLGYEPEEVLGREVFEFMPPGESARIREEFYKSARKREALVGIENVNIRKDGRRVVLETSGVPKLDAMGNLLGYRGIDRDITRRRSAEKELRDKDVKLRELAQRLNYHIENSPMAVIEWGPDMRLIRWAGKAERIFGWRADEVLGKRMEEFPWIYKEDEAQVAQVSAELQSGADPQRFSANRNYRKDGSVIHCEWYNSSLVDNSGKLQSILSMVLDVTYRVTAEQALRKSEERLKLVTEGARLGIWDWDLITDKTVWNTLRYDLLGRDPNGPGITGETFFEYIHPDDTERIRKQLTEAFQNGSDLNDEFRVVREDGEIRWLAAAARVYRNPEGRPVRMAGVNYDITDRKRLEEQLSQYRDELEIRVWERTSELNERTRELEELNKELLGEIDTRRRFEADLKEAYQQRDHLSRRLVDLLERERREIGNALHEDVGQIMTGAILNMERLKTAVSDQDSDPVENVTAIQEVLRDAVKKVRNISRNLRSEALERFGLLPAIRELAADIEREAGIRVRLFVKDIPENLHEKRKDMVIYRVVQESLTNAVKHAKPDEIFINLIKRENHLSLSIDDNGIGFDYDAVLKTRDGKEGSLGLTIMKERVIQVGGQFYVETAPDRGTRIFVEIPLDS